MTMRKLLLSAVTLLLVGCSTTLPGTQYARAVVTSPSLAFDDSADNLVIDVDSHVHGGPPFQYEGCSHVANMRVWGNGRVVVASFKPDVLQVLTGHLTKAKLSGLIQFLYDHFYSNAWTSEPPNPAAIDFGLAVHLQSETLKYSWGERSEPPIYQQLLAQIDPNDLAPFVPQKAQLMVAPGKVEYPAPPIRPEWPAQFGLSLSQVGPGGTPISGQVLAYVWDALNHNVILSYKEGSRYYTVWLEIPEISMPDPRYGCPGV
jgi:hypothetical protein